MHHKLHPDESTLDLDTKAQLLEQEAYELEKERKAWESKVEFFETRYKTIIAATGLSDATEIINKYYFNDEISNDLTLEIKKKKETIASLETEYNDNAKSLAASKGEHVYVKWKDTYALN